MSKIKVEWQSQGSEVEYNVYRDTKMINPTDLPTPIATTEDTYYVDDDVAHGSVYYYVIERVSKADNLDRTVSKNRIVACLENAYVATVSSVMKLDAFSNTVWTANVAARPIAIQADNDGGVYVALSDGTMSKFDYEGNEVWSEQLMDSISAFTLFDTRMHVIGESTNFSTSGDGIAIVSTFDGAPVTSHELSQKPIDITVVGENSYTVCENGDFVVYNKNGVRQRTGNRLLTSQDVRLEGSSAGLYLSEGKSSFVKIDTSSFLNDGASFTRSNESMVVAGDGSVFIIENDQDMNIRRVKSDRLNGWGVSVSNATAISVDASRNVIVQAGTSVVKLNNQGVKLWEKSVPGMTVICTEPSNYWK